MPARSAGEIAMYSSHRAAVGRRHGNVRLGRSCDRASARAGLKQLAGADAKEPRETRPRYQPGLSAYGWARLEDQSRAPSGARSHKLLLYAIALRISGH